MEFHTIHYCGAAAIRNDSEVAVTTYYEESATLFCVAVDALHGPQVTIDGVRLTGRVPSELAHEFIEYAVSHGVRSRTRSTATQGQTRWDSFYALSGPATSFSHGPSLWPGSGLIASGTSQKDLFLKWNGRSVDRPPSHETGCTVQPTEPAIGQAAFSLRPLTLLTGIRYFLGDNDDKRLQW